MSSASIETLIRERLAYDTFVKLCILDFLSIELNDALLAAYVIPLNVFAYQMESVANQHSVDPMPNNFNNRYGRQQQPQPLVPQQLLLANRAKLLVKTEEHSTSNIIKASIRFLYGYFRNDENRQIFKIFRHLSLQVTATRMKLLPFLVGDAWCCNFLDLPSQKAIDLFWGFVQFRVQQIKEKEGTISDKKALSLQQLQSLSIAPDAKFATVLHLMPNLVELRIMWTFDWRLKRLLSEVSRHFTRLRVLVAQGQESAFHAGWLMQQQPPEVVDFSQIHLPPQLHTIDVTFASLCSNLYELFNRCRALRFVAMRYQPSRNEMRLSHNGQSVFPAGSGKMIEELHLQHFIISDLEIEQVFQSLVALRKLSLQKCRFVHAVTGKESKDLG